VGAQADGGGAMNTRGAGGTPGGIGSFLVGCAMSVVGAYLLTQRIAVGSGPWMLWGYSTFGLSLLPLLVGVGMLFFNGRSRIGWGLLGAGLLIILAGVVANMQIYFPADEPVRHADHAGPARGGRGPGRAVAAPLELSVARPGAWAFAATLGAALGAAGGGPALAQPSPAYDAELCLPGPQRDALPASWSSRRRMVHAAVCEWGKFGFPTVVVREVADDRTNRLPGELALPEALSRAVPPSAATLTGVRRAVEVQVRFGRSESDLTVYDRVAAYWRATSPGYARAVEAAGRERPRLRPGWWVAWSAAFVSWTLGRAGVGWVSPDDNHSVYLRSAMAARPGSVVSAEGFRPLAGDLLCFPRLAPEGAEDALSPDPGGRSRPPSSRGCAAGRRSPRTATWWSGATGAAWWSSAAT
jgi:hypothetical protein